MTVLTLRQGRAGEFRKEWEQEGFVLFEQLRGALGTPVPYEGGSAGYHLASQLGNMVILESSGSSIGRIAWLLTGREPNWVFRIANEANVEQAYFIAEVLRRPWMLSLPAALVEYEGRRISIEAANVLRKLESVGLNVRDWVEVGAYLTKHGALGQVMTDAVSDIRKHFPDAPLSLEMYRDPEIKGYQYPIVYVHVAELREAHFERLETIGEILDKRLNGVSGWLAVDLKSIG